MTYTTNIPVSGDSLGGTRDRIRTNFEQIDTVFSNNHVEFNDADQGKHKYLQMPEVTASGAGIPSTAVNEGGLYTNVGTTPAQTNLFFRGESSGFEYQLSSVDSTKTATFGANPGWSFLAGNIKLLRGSTANTNGSPTITFATLGLPDFSDANYQVFVTRERLTALANTDNWFFWVFNKQSTSFRIIADENHSYVYNWMAIGV